MSSSSDCDPTKTSVLKNYTKFSGLAYQLLGLILLSIFLGFKIDTYFGNVDNKYFTAVLIFMTFSFFMLKLYKTLFSKK